MISYSGPAHACTILTRIHFAQHERSALLCFAALSSIADSAVTETKSGTVPEIEEAAAEVAAALFSNAPLRTPFLRSRVS